MKRVLILTALTALFITGCASEGNTPVIEDYTWELRVIQSGNEGDVIAQGSGVGCDGAPEIEMTCKVRDGKLVMEDLTNGVSYEGTYILEDASPSGTIYKVAFGETEGYAGTGNTTFSDGSETPTLNFAVGDYALTFVYGEYGG